MLKCPSNKKKETYWQKHSLSYTLTPQLLLFFYTTNGNLCWKWFPDSMYLITLVHTVPCSICTLWGRFVSADGSPLSAMRTKAVLEIKTSSSDFRICYSPKHKFITFPQYLLVVWSFQFWYFFFLQISRRLKCCTLCSSTTLTFLSFAFFLFLTYFYRFHPICLCFSCPRQSKLSHSHMHLSKLHR